jgi:heme exporter protein A
MKGRYATMLLVNMASVRLIIDGVSKAYGTRRVFANIVAELVLGDVLLITGRNGAGKSTLLRLLAGLQRPSSGMIVYELAGEQYDPAMARAAIGLVGPDVQLYRELTAGEHVAFIADVRGLSYDQAVQRQILASVGLAGREDTLVGSFSAGMQQRLRYALALMSQPAVLLLDEPTTNLDTAGIALVDQIVAEQRQRGIAVIATNDPRDRRYGTVALALDEA